jgi:hypothetical protein
VRLNSMRISLRGIPIMLSRTTSVQIRVGMRAGLPTRLEIIHERSNSNRMMFRLTQDEDRRRVANSARRSEISTRRWSLSTKSSVLTAPGKRNSRRTSETGSPRRTLGSASRRELRWSSISPWLFLPTMPEFTLIAQRFIGIAAIERAPPRTTDSPFLRRSRNLPLLRGGTQKRCSRSLHHRSQPDRRGNLW